MSERLSYAGESLSHGLLPGLVLAALAGAPLLLGAAGGALVAAGSDRRSPPATRASARTPAPAWRSPAWSGSARCWRSLPDAPQRLEELLFGDPLGVATATWSRPRRSLLASAALALAALHRPLAATAFDPAGAGALGLRPGLVRLPLLGLMAAAIAVAVQGLGALLVLAVLVAPAGRRARAACAPPGRGDGRRRGGGSRGRRGRDPAVGSARAPPPALPWRWRSAAPPRRLGAACRLGGARAAARSGA